ncbi:MAG: DNA internalization-related competence protein ComEC/Rec2, partial [Rubrivivax sp.]
MQTGEPARELKHQETDGRHGPCAGQGHLGAAGLALAWLAGVAWQLQQAQVLPHTLAGTLLLGAGVTLTLLARGWHRRRLFEASAIAAAHRTGQAHLWLPALALISLFCLGWAVTDLRASARLQQALDPALEGQDLVLTGTVASLPRVSAHGVRFVFQVDSAQRAVPEGEPVRVPDRLSLGWFQGWDVDTALSRPSVPLVAGDRWRLPVRLKRPHGAVNPQGFDLERWLFEQDLRATGHVRPGAQRLAAAAAHPLERLRQHWRDAILLRVPDPAAAGVLAALAVGDQASIDAEGWELFRTTGVAHLMSISGLHVTMWAWLAAGVVGWAWRRGPRLMLWRPAQTAALVGGLLLAATYAAVAGWGVPAQRTVLMLAVVVVLRLSGRHWPGPLVLLASAVAVTLMDPWAVGQPGLWLSFFAGGMRMVADPVWRPAPRGLASGEAAAAAFGAPGPGTGPAWRLAPQAAWRAHVAPLLRTQAIATAGLAPLTLVFFQQVSVVGFLANLVAIPLVTLLITPLALAGLLLPPLWTVAAWGVQGLTLVLQHMATWPLAVWNAAAAPPWAVAAGLLGGALLVMPLPWRLRLLGLPLMLPLLVPQVERPPAGRFETVVVDVGQGTAVLVRTAGHLLLYDAGPQYTPEADAGQRVLVPLLRARGERAVDLLVLSHRDLDHVGGAASLMKALPVRQMSSSLEAFHPLRAMLPAHQRCDAGQRWEWDGVRFEMLHPLPDEHPPPGLLPARPNALSCVLRVSDASGRSLLLTGDIEAAQEAALVARSGTRPGAGQGAVPDTAPSPAGPVSPLASDALLVPHHGSRTSSTPAVLDAVAPRVAVVQAAHRSRFGHPSLVVMARYAEAGVPVVTTAACG